ncbi:MAG: hypothetical protein QG654_300 [Patescibacteria group bacterium]|nr:hypothetical protein [Patescibacteria group bacterium]
MEKNISLNVNLDNENLKLQKEVESHLAELRIISRSNLDVKTGSGFYNYYLDKYNKEDLEKSQIKKCFKGLVSSLHEYIDRLMAICELTKGPIKASRDLKNEEDKLSFILEKIEEIKKSISNNSNLKVPQKLKYFFPSIIDIETINYIQNYFDLRNAIEHKNSIPKKDIILKYKGRPKIIIDNKEITKEQRVEGGQLLEIRILEISKTFKKDEEINISHEEIEDIGFTVSITIVNLFVLAFNKIINSSVKPS